MLVACCVWLARVANVAGPMHHKDSQFLVFFLHSQRPHPMAKAGWVQPLMLDAEYQLSKCQSHASPLLGTAFPAACHTHDVTGLICLFQCFRLEDDFWLHVIRNIGPKSVGFH